VLLNHSYDSEFLGYDCSRCCPCKPLYNYTYTGEVTNQNLGDNTTIAASAYDWGKEFDFPEGKYLRIYRSFFKFDFSKFTLPSYFINDAILDFWGTGSEVAPEGPYGFKFHLSPVTNNWSEYDVTWANQPTVTQPIATLKNPKTQPYGYVLEQYQVSVKNLVKTWVANPEYNYGLRLSLEEEEANLDLDYASNRKRIMIAGSDEGGPNPFDTKVDIQFANPNYNPQNFTIDAGHVEPGDTVLVALNNGNARRPAAIGGRSEAFMVDGDSIDGFVLPFEDRFKNTTNRPIAYLGEEQIQAFIYIGEKNEEMKISLEMSEQDELWPSIPVGGANADFDFSQVESVMNNIQVEVTRNEEPVPGQPVAVMAQWVEESGGHNHDGKNDMKHLQSGRLGIVTNIETADSASGILNTVTNTEGRLNLRYHTPEFGGEIKLIAKTVNTSGDTLRAESQFTVGVPNLVLLPDGDNYEKVGGTSSHYGPRVDGAYSEYREPDNNHYTTVAFRDSLIAIAEAWADTVQADSTLDNRQTPLNINDISLPNGGKFDVEGRWLTRLRNAAHDFHRVGRDADIRTLRSFESECYREGRNAIILSEYIENGVNLGFKNILFEEIAEESGASPSPMIHGTGCNEHYHIYFYNN